MSGHVLVFPLLFVSAQLGVCVCVVVVFCVRFLSSC